MPRVKNFLLTGKPGTGKTTAIIEALRLLSADAGGFYTKEIREGGERKGFEIISLDRGSRVMAQKGYVSKCRVGSYGIDVGAINDFGVPLIMDAIDNKSLIVIDEIGKMELFSKEFFDSALKALSSEKPVIGVIMKKENKLADTIKKRDDTMIMEVTEENRDKIPGQLAKLVKEVLA